jgi:hypothetical protein
VTPLIGFIVYIDNFNYVPFMYLLFCQ